MTGSNPDPHTPEDDLDPTGVRALLANLPDPGPMPDELVQRISQSLELEQERRVSAAGSAGFGDPDHRTAPEADSTSAIGGNVVSLTTERRRRRPGRTVLWLGGAAAVAMIATVSVNQLIGDDTPSDTGVAAHVPSGTDSGESNAQDESAEEQAESGHEDAAGPGSTPDDDPGDGADNDADELPPNSVAEPPPLSNDGAGDVSSSTRIYAVAGTVELTSPDWDDDVSTWLSSTLSREESTWGAAQVSDCLADGELDTGQANRVVLSEAVWAQEPATLVVAEASAGDTAWVLTPDCHTVLSGPTPLD